VDVLAQNRTDGVVEQLKLETDLQQIGGQFPSVEQESPIHEYVRVLQKIEPGPL
jgi:hypothetical protein